MRYRIVAATGALLVAMNVQVLPGGAGQALPVRNGRPIVATVNRDAIALDELVLQIGPSADIVRLRQGLGTAEDLALLARLVDIKLVVQEAATMGLDQAPEIRKQVEVTSREILREVLVARLAKDARADPLAVEKLFKESVKEWRTESLLFQDETAARRAQKEIAGGAALKDVAARAIAAKAAKLDADNGYHTKKDYLPEVAAALAGLQAGQVSPVIRIKAGFVVVKVAAVRYPENPEARAEARNKVLAQRQQALLNAHEQAARRERVVVHEAVLKSIDYEAPKPGVDALLKDKRVVAEIRGVGSVTVADLTEYLRLQFFHGSGEPAQRKRMNSRKVAALDATLSRRLLNAEALKLGIDKTAEYRDRVKGYTESLIFDQFVQTVIVPVNKMREEEVKQYHASHVKEYSYPEMLRVRGLAFTRRSSAEAAMRKLREGADFGWLAANAEGQVDKGAEGPLVFDGRPVTTGSMPEGAQRALAGVKMGDSRLYAGPQGYFYVLTVQQVIAAKARPYDEVREEIAKKLYGEKLKRGVDEYTAKLRAHAKVQIHLKRVQ